VIASRANKQSLLTRFLAQTFAPLNPLRRFRIFAFNHAPGRTELVSRILSALVSVLIVSSDAQAAVPNVGAHGHGDDIECSQGGRRS
jgi:hypothetical protein